MERCGASGQWRTHAENAIALGGEPEGRPGGAILAAMIDSTHIAPGARVRVIAQIPKGDTYLTTAYEGVVRRFGQQKTGSWFAHSRDKKLWLDRLELVRDDGEVVVCNLDQYTRVEVIEPAA